MKELKVARAISESSTTSDNTSDFIDIVKKYDVVYNNHNPDYKNVEVKMKVWTQIADEIGLSVGKETTTTLAVVERKILLHTYTHTRTHWQCYKKGSCVRSRRRRQRQQQRPPVRSNSITTCTANMHTTNTHAHTSI